VSQADVITGVVTFFATSMGNAVILGFFLGGVKSDIAALRREVSEIKGAFTLVPRSSNVDKTLSLVLVRSTHSISNLRIRSHNHGENPIYTERLYLASRTDKSSMDRATIFHRGSLYLPRTPPRIWTSKMSASAFVANKYVLQIDATHENVNKLPTNLIAVMGYDTGTPDVQWTMDDWNRFPVASRVHVDQSFLLQFYGTGISTLADVERGAATIETFIAASTVRQARGLNSNLYISFANWQDARDQIKTAKLTKVRYAIADYNFSEYEAIEFMENNSDVVMVQFGSPGTNASTVIPGGLTVGETGCDISVKLASWWPSPAIAGTGWAE
jgi:hypothetical protein